MVTATPSFRVRRWPSIPGLWEMTANYGGCPVLLHLVWLTAVPASLFYIHVRRVFPPPFLILYHSTRVTINYVRHKLWILYSILLFSPDCQPLPATNKLIDWVGIGKNKFHAFLFPTLLWNWREKNGIGLHDGGLEVYRWMVLKNRI